MKVICFSSFSFSYLNRARVLFSSLRKHQPNWHLIALITDEPPPGFAFKAEPENFDSVVFAADLDIDGFDSWIFKHDVIEACTAVKGPFVRQACSSGADAIVYLDPDTCLFGNLDPIEELLESYDVILTPHQLSPERDPQAIVDNEIGSLKWGIYNLGFCALRTSGEGLRFAHWWADRLFDYCYDDVPSGLFVDQRWCDIVPSIFDKVKILRDPGYNVASWNLSNRKIAIGRDGAISVNDRPLRFWHFTKLGPVGDVMTKRYAGDNFPVYELWSWYRRQVENASEATIPSRYWAYGTYHNGQPIAREHRLRYRSDETLRLRFPDPFRTGPGSYLQWLGSQGLDGPRPSLTAI